METALNRFETLFQKAESDLDYIQHRLEFEIMKSLPDNPAPEENPIALLEELSRLKSHYKTLSMQLDKIFTEQRESMECIRSGLNNVMGMVQTIQQCADLERLPLSEEEWAAVQLLTCQTVKGMESPVEKELEPSVFSSTEDIMIVWREYLPSLLPPAGKPSFRPRAALSVSQMNKMNMEVTVSRIPILKELAVVELDKQGNVKLVV